MIRKLLSFYKTPLLASVTVAVIIIALEVLNRPLSIALAILGALIGTFFLDLDYILYAYFLDPQSDFSRTLQGFFKHRDFGGAFQYIQYHKDDVKEKTLHSVVFQLAWAGITIFGVPAATNYLVKSLILSVFINTIYRMIEYTLSDRTEDWFWALKNKPGKSGIIIYTLGLMVVFVYSLTQL